MNYSKSLLLASLFGFSVISSSSVLGQSNSTLTHVHGVSWQVAENKATPKAAPKSTSEPKKGGEKKGGAGVEVGRLVCEITKASTFIIGSKHELGCTFKQATSGRSEKYLGTITGFGIDIGPVKSGTIVWGVLAPSVNMKPGALEGSYGGVSAGFALGAGVQSNILIGGSLDAFTLQPVSLQSQTGANIRAGITGLTLTATK
ncbi:DUF992 domain-containing protein [Polycladidibacter stylochi]|uniref:DUF992 domain-containing protein n=1 Tax=Polycladidibacter stylochi TaxID=1807766 RepID=UPI0008359505|nr:DUF992 domain-containing protein [Pseudovibrio stylochi]